MSSKIIAFNRFSYLLKRKNRFAFFCHKKPDSDTVGSMVGLALALLDEKKTIDLYSPDPIPKNLSFLPLSSSVCNLADIKKIKYDVGVSFDCGDLKQTDFFEHLINYKNFFPLLVNIDHHGNEEFGDLNMVDDQSSSTAEIVYDLLIRLEIKINKEIATALLAGIIGDTDNFKNPNTSIATLETTSSLLLKGANLKKITKYLHHNKSHIGLKLWGKVLSRIKRHDTLNIVSTFVTHDDIMKTGCTNEDIEGIANFLNSIPNVNASLLLAEIKEGEIKGSLRTLQRDRDVSKIAHFFGGGGHREAAGFSLRGKILYNDNKVTIS